MLTDDIIKDLESIEWEKIVSINVEDCNDRSGRFVKGSVVEYAIEKYNGNTDLTYVNQVHKDFDWPSKNLSVEVKSQLSSEIYTKSGGLRTSYTVKLNNSNGTNKKDSLNPSDVADIILVVRRDGAFCVDKETVLANARKTGDGFEVTISKNDIVEITGKLDVPSRYTNIREKMTNVIKEAI